MCRNVFLIRREVLFAIFLIRNCLLTWRKGSRECFWAGKNPRHTQITEARCCIYLSIWGRGAQSLQPLWGNFLKQWNMAKEVTQIPITNVVALPGRYYTLAFTQIKKKADGHGRLSYISCFGFSFLWFSESYYRHFIYLTKWIRGNGRN